MADTELTIMADDSKHDAPERPSNIKQKSILNKACDDMDKVDDVIPMNLSQDAYSTLVLLKEHGYLDLMTKPEQCSLYILVFLTAFTQLSGAITLIYITSTGEIWKDESNVIINGESAVLIDNRGLGHMSDFGGMDFFTRISAVCVLFVYCCQNMASFVDYSVLIKHTHYLLWYMIMLLFQLSVLTITIRVAGDLILSQSNNADVFSTGVGFVILLEVDDYMGRALNMTSNYINSSLFFHRLTQKECENTIYGKYKPLTIKTIIIILQIVGWILIVLEHLIHFNLGYHGKWIYRFVMMIGLFFIFVPIFYPFAISFKSRYQRN